MKEFTFKVKTHSRKRYTIFIERGVLLEFCTKKEVKAFIKAYKHVIYDVAKSLHYLNCQTYNIYTIHCMHLDAKTSFDFNDYHKGFNDSFYWAFENPYKDSEPTVQFTKIRRCFDFVEDSVITLKKYAQKHKKTDMLEQLHPISLLWELLLKDYNKRVKDLKVDSKYRDLFNLRIVTDDNKTDSNKRVLYS